jgi:SAM-dependent methyltransferase
VPDRGDALPEEFLQTLVALEESYLESDDPIRQSGFGGGPERWRAEREPILDAIDSDGDLIDVCCANGYLLECLVAWGSERGLTLTPHGLDLGARLIRLARHRLPGHAAQFAVGNAWDFHPPRRYRYLYALCDCVPEAYLGEFVDRLLTRFLDAGGRLILGAYGSRSRGISPFDVGGFLGGRGYGLAGSSEGGTPPIARFAWVDAPPSGLL